MRGHGAHLELQARRDTLDDQRLKQAPGEIQPPIEEAGTALGSRAEGRDGVAGGEAPEGVVAPAEEGEREGV